MKITTVGVDLAKKLVQVQGVDERGTPVLWKQLKRSQVLSFSVSHRTVIAMLEHQLFEAFARSMSGSSENLSKKSAVSRAARKVSGASPRAPTTNIPRRFTAEGSAS